MKTLLLPLLVRGTAAACLVMLCAASANAQTRSSDTQLAKEQADLEKKRVELEKKSVELQQREAELDRARQELQNQESGRSLSMNLSGDVLFDYDKAH